MLAGSAPALCGASDPIRWEPSLETAQRLAGQTNRLVLIHFSAPWCQHCKWMESQVFTQPQVAAAMGDYVPVKINADNFPAPAKKYGVTFLPATIIALPDGRPLATVQKRMDADQYVALLSRVATDAKQRGGPILAQVPGGSAAPAAPFQPTAQAAPTGPISPPTAGAIAQPAIGPAGGQPSPASQPTNAYPQSGPSLPPSNVYTPGSTAAPPINAAPSVASRPPVFSPASVGQPSAPATTTPPYGPGSIAPPNQPLTPSPSAGPMTSPAPAAPYGSMSSAPSNQPAIPQPGAGQPTIPSPTAAPYGTAPAASNPPAAPASVAPNLPNGVTRDMNPPLGLEGFCPVSVCERQQWVRGDRRWGAIHRGRTYLFAGPEEQRKFFTDPDRYAPAVSGNDIVLATEQGQAVPGSRRHGVFFENRIYLFSSEASLKKFLGNSKAYASQATEALRSGAARGQQLW
ncbi:MAG: thioredoxin family protein [Thermoguttaceae bacterium]